MDWNTTFELPIRALVVYGGAALILTTMFLCVKKGITYLVRLRGAKKVKREEIELGKQQEKEEEKQQKKKQRMEMIESLPGVWKELYGQLQGSYFETMVATIESFSKQRGLPPLSSACAKFLCDYCMNNPGSTLADNDEKRMYRVSNSLAPHIANMVKISNSSIPNVPPIPVPDAKKYCWERGFVVPGFWERVVDSVFAADDPAARISSFVAFCRSWKGVTVPKLTPADVEALVVKIGNGDWEGRRAVAMACEPFISGNKIG